MVASDSHGRWCVTTMTTTEPIAVQCFLSFFFYSSIMLFINTHLLHGNSLRFEARCVRDRDGTVDRATWWIRGRFFTSELRIDSMKEWVCNWTDLWWTHPFRTLFDVRFSNVCALRGNAKGGDFWDLRKLQTNALITWMRLNVVCPL